MSYDRIAQNLLTILILFGFGWIVYNTSKGNDVFRGIRNKFSKMKGGKKNE